MNTRTWRKPLEELTRASAHFPKGRRELYLFVSPPPSKLPLTYLQQTKLHINLRPITRPTTHLRQIHRTPQFQQTRYKRLPLPRLQCPRPPRPIVHHTIKSTGQRQGTEVQETGD